MRITFQSGTADDANALAELHNTVSENLTDSFGQGPWSRKTTDAGVLYAMRHSRVFVAWDDTEIVATWRLATKPWAIDTSYFTKCQCPLYLLGMAVAPARQRRGIGRRCIDEAIRIAGTWPADVIRLDAYDAEAGGGGFYSRCGFKETGRTTYRDTPLIYFEMRVKSLED